MDSPSRTQDVKLAAQQRRHEDKVQPWKQLKGIVLPKEETFSTPNNFAETSTIRLLSEQDNKGLGG
jgi:hypothetical protein